MLKVAKFGGSSVASAEQFRKVKDIVLSDPSRKLVVVSAAGKRDSKDHKITDLLYLCHAHITYGVPCDDIFDRIRERFIEIRDQLGLTFPIEKELDAIRSKISKDMSVDELVSRGEYLTSKLMAEYLGYYFLDASNCIYMDFDGKFQPRKIAEALSGALKEHSGIVIPGFYGSLPSGK
ncbi:MAG: amino acid kinase family protein, partial [Spirochaetales bacterium]